MDLPYPESGSESQSTVMLGRGGYALPETDRNYFLFGGSGDRYEIHFLFPKCLESDCLKSKPDSGSCYLRFLTSLCFSFLVY